MEKTDKGYEVDGLNIWYHPFRLDMYPGLRKKQLANLRERLGDKAATAAIRQDETKRRQGDSRNVNHLKLIRGHHIQNGGVVYDMAKLAPHLEATWANDIVLDYVEMTKVSTSTSAIRSNTTGRPGVAHRGRLRHARGRRGEGMDADLCHQLSRLG